MQQENIAKRALVLMFWVLILAGMCFADDASKHWQVQSTPEIISQELRFSNGNARLIGTVYLPAKGDHLPAVVAFHSASAGTREAGLYRHLAETLPAIGFAVLIYDRRGEGQSTGNLENIDYETLADDGIAGQHALAQLAPRIDPKKIGFWGLSQGGWLAVLAAGRSKDAAFAVSISAPLTSPEEQMRFAMTNLMAIGGYSQSDIQQMLDTRKAWTGYLRGSNSRSEAFNALQNAESKPWLGQVYLPTAANLTNDPEHYSWTHEMDGDPAAALAKVKIPLLVLYGDSDPWIPVAKSIEKLQGMAYQKRNIEYAVVANADHEMMLPIHETMQIDEKTIRTDAPQSPEYFVLLGSWLARQGGK